MTQLADYILGGILLCVFFNCIIGSYVIIINGKLRVQQKLIDFIHTRALKAKQLEELREKSEEQRIAKLKKTAKSQRK